MEYGARVLPWLGAMGLVLTGCSSAPRRFDPILAAPAADPASFDAVYATCRRLLAARQLDSNGRLASGATGAAAGAATLALGGAAASSAGLYGGMAVLSATVVALPFVAVAGAVGMAKAKRHKKEKVIDAQLSGCLKERGYDVVSWHRAPKVRKVRPVRRTDTAA